MHGEFQFDDEQNIVNNHQIKSLDRVFTREALLSVLYGGRPITNFTFALNYYYGRLNVTGYHMVNVAIHLLVVVTMFFLIRRLLVVSHHQLQANSNIDLLVAAYVALHPINTQAVSYICQRAESLSTLFYLASLLMFALASETLQKKKYFLFYFLSIFFVSLL
jgi:hypothetical protein